MKTKIAVYIFSDIGSLLGYMKKMMTIKGQNEYLYVLKN
jgi:hypothetical protein